MFLQAGKWHWRNGYGVIVQNQTTSPASSSIQILKLYGAINWTAQGSSIWVDDQSSSFFDLTPDEVQLPPGVTAYYGEAVLTPSYLKQPTLAQHLAPIWNKAAAALQIATKVVVIGYSLQAADSHVRKMLQARCKAIPSLLFKLFFRTIQRCFLGGKSCLMKRGRQWNHAL